MEYLEYFTNPNLVSATVLVIVSYFYYKEKTVRDNITPIVEKNSKKLNQVLLELKSIKHYENAMDVNKKEYYSILNINIKYFKNTPHQQMLHNMSDEIVTVMIHIEELFVKKEKDEKNIDMYIEYWYKRLFTLLRKHKRRFEDEFRKKDVEKFFNNICEKLEIQKNDIIKVSKSNINNWVYRVHNINITFLSELFDLYYDNVYEKERSIK